MKIPAINFCRYKIVKSPKLSILEGSSMSGNNVPRNLGESPDDSLLKKIKFAWDMMTGKRDGSGTFLKETAKNAEIKEVTKDHSENIFDHVLDILDDIF